MNRHLSERLMTVDEAIALSHSAAPTHGPSDERRPSIWAWQTVEGAMAQTVSDEQIDRAIRARRIK